MHIGIDGRLLSKPLSGIPRFACSMTDEVLLKPGRFSIFSLEKVGDRGLGGSSFSSYYPSFGHLKRNQIRELLFRALCPLWIARAEIDVFWSPNHRLPRRIPRSVARVITVHDLVWQVAPETMKPFNRLLDKGFMPWAIQQSDIIVTVSQSTAAAVKAAFPTKSEHVRVVYEGVTPFPKPENFASLQAIGIGKPFILAVGTIEPRKNYENLLTAFARLEPHIRKSVQLVIAGSYGWGGVDLKSLISRLQLESSVVLLGRVTDQILATLYGHAQFLAMPSLYEGFGLPIIEAMSFGTPVLTSNNSSMPEVAGAGGLLIDPYNTGSIAEGIKTLLDSEIRQSFSDKARAHAKEFTWQRAASQLWSSFYEAKELAAIRTRAKPSF